MCAIGGRTEHSLHFGARRPEAHAFQLGRDMIVHMELVHCVDDHRWLTWIELCSGRSPVKRMVVAEDLNGLHALGLNVYGQSLKKMCTHTTSVMSGNVHGTQVRSPLSASRNGLVRHYIRANGRDCLVGACTNLRPEVMHLSARVTPQSYQIVAVRCSTVFHELRHLPSQGQEIDEDRSRRGCT